MSVRSVDGATIIDGSDIARFRLLVLRSALYLEVRNIRVKPFSVTARVKREFGLRGNKKSVYAQFCAMHHLPLIEDRHANHRQPSEK